MIWFLIALLIFFVEHQIKVHFERTLQFGQTIEKWKGRIRLHKYHNRGAMLNIMEKYPKLLIGITGTMLLFVATCLACLSRKRGNYLQKTAWTLILGGGFSNLWDRVTKSYVVDYVSFSWKKVRHIVFNIADFCIFIGTFLLGISTLQKSK